MPRNDHENEITMSNEEFMIFYRTARAREYLRNNKPQDGKEPRLEYCIIQDLVKLINKE